LRRFFNQDLNRDGVVGPPITVIQVDESTSLTEVGPYYFLYNSGSGPELKYGGAAVTQGEFGTWAPIGAVQTASGYDIAWKDASSGLYTIWTTDANGNYLGNAIGASPGNSYALESFETIFDQDLNGDGVVGFYAAPSTTLQISQPLSGTSGAATIGTNAVLEISGTDSATVTFAASTGMLKLDQPSTFSAQIFNFTGDGTLSGSDQIDLKGVNFSTVHDSYANGVLTVTDGTHSAELNFNGSYVLANFKLADDGSGGTIVYDPPVPGPSQGLAGTQVSTDPHNDAFAFHPNLGQSFGSQQEDVAEADHYRVALALATSTTMHDAHEWAIFGQFAYEAIANHDGAAAQAQHHAHFLI
jgi:serralysin